MPPKRQRAWNTLHDKMKNKTKKVKTIEQQGTKAGSAPHELIVQRLASQPDHKQTFKSVQPREFVQPACLCDVVVTNEGSSYTQVNQTLDRKDKVFSSVASLTI